MYMEPSKNLYTWLSRFIGKSLNHIVELVFSFLDLKSIVTAETVSKSWRKMIRASRIWEAFVKAKVTSGFSDDLILRSDCNLVLNFLCLKLNHYVPIMEEDLQNT